MVRRQNLFNMFGRKRNNRGFLWTTLLGLGISIATLGLRRNGNRNMVSPIQNIMNSILSRNGQMPKIAAGLTEFSKELTPNKDQIKNK